MAHLIRHPRLLPFAQAPGARGPGRGLPAGSAGPLPHTWPATAAAAAAVVAAAAARACLLSWRLPSDC